MTQSHMRDSSTCNVVCLSPGHTSKLSHGFSRHGIPVMRLPEACHVVDFWYFCLVCDIRTASPAIPQVIQAWHLYLDTLRSVQYGKFLLELWKLDIKENHSKLKEYTNIQKTVKKVSNNEQTINEQ